MKKILFIFFLFFTFSNSAHSATYRKVTSLSHYYSGWNCVSVGDVVPTTFTCGATYQGKSGWEVRIGSKTKAYHPNYANRISTLTSPFTSTSVDGCPVGHIPNETTGVCEEPKVDFCSSSEFLEISASEGNACAAKYPDFLTDFSSTCVDESNYSFTCNQGVEKPPVTDPDPTDPDPTDPDPTDPDPTDPDPTDPDPTDPDPTDPDPTDPDPTDPDPTDPDTPDSGNRPNPDYDNSGNAHGSGSSGGSASASDGNVSVDISFDGVHNRLDAVNENLAGTNERIETTNDLLTDFANSFDKSTDKSNKALGDINDQLTKNGKQVSDGLDAANNLLGDIADGSNTDVGENGCDVGSFTCTGNTYECFVARSAWKNNCLISSLTGDIGTGEGVPVEHSQAVNDSGDALINDLKDYTVNKGNVDKLSNGEIALSDTLSKYNESNGFNFDDRCPSPTQVNYGLGSFELNYQPFCDLALYIRAMLMLTASIGSVLMIAKHS